MTDNNGISHPLAQRIASLRLATFVVKPTASDRLRFQVNSVVS